MLTSFETSMKEFVDKSIKNKETVGNIKENLNLHNQSFSELNRRLNDYNNNLHSVSLLLKTEMETIKSTITKNPNLPQKDINEIDQALKAIYEIRFKFTENQEKELLKLKDDLSKRIHATLNQPSFGPINNEMSDKIANVAKEIASSWGKKIEKVLEHLNGKIAVFEKQVATYDRQEDSIIDKIKFEIENRLSHSQIIFNEQVKEIRWLLDQKPDVNKIIGYIGSGNLVKFKAFLNSIL